MVIDDRYPGGDSLLATYATAMLRGDGDDPVGTDHLLLALAGRPGIAPLLDTAEATHTVLRAVHESGVAGAADGDGEPGRFVMADGGEPASFTPAAAAALRRAAEGRTVVTPEDLFRALLTTGDHRAARLLAACGTSGAAVLDPPPPAADPVPEELRHLRDILLGRRTYEPRGWRQFFGALFAKSRPNYAARPVLWVRYESAEQAPDRPCTDHVLLAILATHEVAVRYPHLTVPPAAAPAGEHPAPGAAGQQGALLTTYRGGARLAAAGLTYRDLRALAATTDLGADPQPVRKLVPSLPDDTLSLLRLILTPGDNRATRLLAAAGHDAAALLR